MAVDGKPDACTAARGIGGRDRRLENSALSLFGGKITGESLEADLGARWRAVRLSPKRSYGSRSRRQPRWLTGSGLGRTIANQKFTRSPPFSESVSRASSGVAMPSPSPSMIWRAARTCCALDSASWPGPIQRRIFQPHPHVAAHRRRHRRDRQLIAAGAEHRPAGMVAKQPVGGALHVHDVLGMRADAAQYPEHGLHKQRRLEPGRVPGSDAGCTGDRRRSIRTRIACRRRRKVLSTNSMSLNVLRKMQIVGVLEMFPLPVVLELLEARQHREQPEIHRSHVERRDLRLERRRRLHPLLHRHVRRAAGGQIDHRVRALLDARKERAERLRRLVRLAGRRDRARAGARSPRQPRRRRSPLRRSRSGVTGRCGDIAGVWIDPVTAQVMMTLRCLAGAIAILPLRPFRCTPSAARSAGEARLGHAAHAQVVNREHWRTGGGLADHPSRHRIYRPRCSVGSCRQSRTSPSGLQHGRC